MPSITDIGQVKAFGNPNLDASRDVALLEAIDAAEQWVQDATGRALITAARTVWFSGADLRSDNLFLHPGHRPVVHSGQTLVTVKEDGQALVVAAGFNAAAEVVVVNANVDRRCRLVKIAGQWSTAWPNNVEVAYTSGWAYGSHPKSVVSLVNEVAWQLFQSPNLLGRASVSRGRSSVSVRDGLSPMAQSTLARLETF